MFCPHAVTDSDSRTLRMRVGTRFRPQCAVWAPHRAGLYERGVALRRPTKYFHFPLENPRLERTDSA